MINRHSLKSTFLCSMVIVAIFCTSCETDQHKLSCNDINGKLGPYKSYLYKFGIQTTYDGITTTDKHLDNELLCHAVMSFKNQFGLSTDMPDILLDYKMYLADNKKNYSIELLNEPEKNIEVSNAFNQYKPILDQSIKFESQVNGSFIYIYDDLNSKTKYLKINDTIVDSISDDGSWGYDIDVSKQFDIDNNHAFIYKIFHMNQTQGSYKDIKTNIIVIESDGKYSSPYKSQNCDSVNIYLTLQANKIESGVDITQIMDHGENATGYDTIFEYANKIIK